LSQKNEQLEVAIQEAEKAKSQTEGLMRSIIHDIRSPLSTTIWCLDTLLYKINSVEWPVKQKIEKFINIALLSWNFALDLVNQLWIFSKEKKTWIRIEKSEIDSKSYISNLQEQWRIYLDDMNKKNKIIFNKDNKDIDIFVNNLDILPDCIYTDQLQLNRILTNLVSNAIKFTNEWSVSLNIEKIENKEKKMMVSLWGYWYMNWYSTRKSSNYIRRI
jgi:signal transduction histidine kinase